VRFNLIPPARIITFVIFMYHLSSCAYACTRPPKNCFWSVNYHALSLTQMIWYRPYLSSNSVIYSRPAPEISQISLSCTEAGPAANFRALNGAAKCPYSAPKSPSAAGRRLGHPSSSTPEDVARKTSAIAYDKDYAPLTLPRNDRGAHWQCHGASRIPKAENLILDKNFPSFFGGKKISIQKQEKDW